MSTIGPCHNIMEANVRYGCAEINRDGPVRILSLDGGGTRGLIGLKVLEEVEKRTQECTCRLFDIMAGTSTGGISVLSLAAPKEEGSLDPKFTAHDITQLYMEKANEIFPPVSWWKKPFQSAEDLLRPTYGPGLEKVVDEYCGDTLFRDALTEVVVPSFEITESEPWYFQRAVARIDPQINPLLMKDIALAATAAPTYFSPYQLIFGDHTYSFIDGGVCDNTPSTTAYGIAKQFFRQQDDKHVMLSLGTGICKEVVTDTNNKNFGELKWAPKIINLVMQGAQQVSEKQTDFLFSSDRLLRLQLNIPVPHNALDDASDANLQYLADVGDELVEDNDERLRDFCNQLTGEKSPAPLDSWWWQRWWSSPNDDETRKLTVFR